MSATPSHPINPIINPITLYPDQDVVLNEIRALLYDGKRRILLQAPTGSGKGTVATYMIHGAVANGRRILFLVNRRELVKDLSRRLDKLSLDHGIIMANHPRRKPWLSVHVASIDTLRNRTLPPADIIVVDEAHFSISDSWLKILEKYPDAAVIGMTATPIRLDGRGLGHVFTDMVCGPSMRELVKLGRLAHPRIFAPSNPDLSGVQKSAGDYNQKQLATAMDKPKLVGDMVEHWLRLGRGRPSVAFCCDIKHSQHVAEQFIKAGVKAKHVDANTPDDERDQAWADLVSGELELITSIGIISYGWDVPPVSCAILARPTHSLALYLQQVGRVLRTAPGKTDAIILDHAGNTLRHGLPDEDRIWTLSGRMGEAEEKERVTSVIVCAECWFTYPSTKDECPACACPRPKEDRSPVVVEGELAEVQREELAKCLKCNWRGKLKAGLDIAKVTCPNCNFMTIAHAWGHDRGADKDAERREFFELERKRRAANYKEGWSKMTFHAKYGYFPPKKWIEEFERTETLAGAL